MGEEKMSEPLFESLRPMYVAQCNGLEGVSNFLTDWEKEFVREVGDLLIDCPTLSVNRVSNLSELYRKHRHRMGGSVSFDGPRAD